MPRKKTSEEPNLTCPYSGRVMTPVFDDTLGHTGWYLKGGVDMAVPFLSKELLYVANTMRRGQKSIAQSLRCAYTGEPLKAVERGGLWYAEPVDSRFAGQVPFSPAKRRDRKPMLLWLCSHRNGKKPGFPKPAKLEVKYPEAEHEHFVDTTAGLAQNASDDQAMELIDKITGS